ncbi:MAG: diaminopimelate decarboxylase [Hyphomonadaceae bacterium]|nr:diaminopimelate decarboxylase [Hyphomonadaceae bacterium]
MNHFHYRDGELWCEDVALSRVAADIGTPVYVYSSATLERHYRVFKEAFAPRDPLVAYAVKANGNIAVIATLARLGAGADTVSAGEIQRALAAGVPPERIVFSGVGKTEAELAYAISLGVHQINIESVAELAMVGRVCDLHARRAAIAIRINPDVGAGGHDKISTGKSQAKFGVSMADARALYARAHAHPLIDAKGFAVHIGSQIRDLKPLEDAFVVLRTLAEEARGQGLAVERLDLGGGLGIPYFNEPPPPSPTDYAAMVTRVFAGDPATLAFEPGRLIAGNAGVLVSRVIRVQERPERPILVLDAAMNDLLRPAMYDAFHDIWPVRDPHGGERSPVDVVGPVCETGDTFTRARALPPLAADDLVAFMSAGAYGAAMASTYNARPLVPEVLVRGDRADVVRRRWKVSEQLELERIPD